MMPRAAFFDALTPPRYACLVISVVHVLDGDEMFVLLCDLDEPMLWRPTTLCYSVARWKQQWRRISATR